MGDVSEPCGQRELLPPARMAVLRHSAGPLARSIVLEGGSAVSCSAGQGVAWRGTRVENASSSDGPASLKRAAVEGGARARRRRRAGTKKLQPAVAVGRRGGVLAAAERGRRFSSVEGRRAARWPAS
ncbi:hypothetical protein SETIT_1G174000v2 [Setaria italica]|uniref:Uncharacterized protein n=1 Tax=Setaria italica TaxID=4555 RepID=A0A368PLC3_SETIT|nr:hypothetical protein SETIT_1G174000v2 [Setaria italica]